MTQCRACRFAEKMHKEYAKFWDFGAAICKATSLHTISLRGADGMWTKQIDATTVRVIMQLQQGRCAITQQQFLYPHDTEALPQGSTLDTWANMLSFDEVQLNLLPVLVRATPNLGWEPGNVVLITRMALPIYRHTKSLLGAVGFMHSAEAAPVPTQFAITGRRAKVMLELKQAWLDQAALKIEVSDDKDKIKTAEKRNRDSAAVS